MPERNLGLFYPTYLGALQKPLQNWTRCPPGNTLKLYMRGAKTAYKAVMKPVEGTMLTVARVTGEQALKLCKKYTDFGVIQ